MSQRPARHPPSNARVALLLSFALCSQAENLGCVCVHRSIAEAAQRGAHRDLDAAQPGLDAPAGLDRLGKRNALALCTQQRHDLPAAFPKLQPPHALKALAYMRLHRLYPPSSWGVCAPFCYGLPYHYTHSIQRI